MATEKRVQRIAREYLSRLGRNITIKQAILTGSWARGSYLEDSDVDLIVVSDDFERMAFADRLAYLQKSWTDKLALEAFGYTASEFRQLRRNSSYVRDAVQHGIPLVQLIETQTMRRIKSGEKEFSRRRYVVAKGPAGIRKALS